MIWMEEQYGLEYNIYETFRRVVLGVLEKTIDGQERRAPIDEIDWIEVEETDTYDVKSDDDVDFNNMNAQHHGELVKKKNAWGREVSL